ncbi:MAG TPA: hypothetical protein PLU87_02445 [Sedimentisphaerales bacterium]|nr:hypothetical protein [Sedimentisphaerales bacterium]HRS09759.1 hypothetical protein [Sedimentisphaerales bacterium]HRV46591.1 hypothetical protein [Sedimentisphaerales bacterium]
MMVALLTLVIVAAGLVILSGLWVAVALVAAVWHGDRHAEGDDEPDAGTP